MRERAGDGTGVATIPRLFSSASRLISVVSCFWWSSWSLIPRRPVTTLSASFVRYSVNAAFTAWVRSSWSEWLMRRVVMRAVRVLSLATFCRLMTIIACVPRLWVVAGVRLWGGDGCCVLGSHLCRRSLRRPMWAIFARDWASAGSGEGA